MGLFDVVGAVLLLVSSSVEDLAGRRAAGVVTLALVAAGACGIAYFLHAPVRSSDPSALTPSPEEDTLVAPEPHRTNAAPPPRAAMRPRPRCGLGAAPLEIDGGTWPAYRCRAPGDAPCLAWNAYTTHPWEGCRGAELCCPPDPPADSISDGSNP